MTGISFSIAIFFKSAITQWSLESLYREVLVFGYFKSVSSAWNFAFQSRSNIGHFLHHTWPEHSYTPLDAPKPHKHTYSSSICSQTPLPGISGQIRITADTIRLQQTPNDTNRLPQTPKKAVQGCAAVCVDMEWRLLVSVGVWRCLNSVLCYLEM